MIGKTISHYHILEQIGQGGMGVVYKAEDTKLKRIVALKFLPPELTRDPETKKRFVQEAQAASALDHANICTIYEIDETEDGQLFIAMACYDGETLKDKIERGSLTIEVATEIATQVARGLSKAHAKGIIHRDIKPANVLITEDNEVKIIDFGLARLSGQSRLTKSFTTMGTMAYMSPEQTRGEEVDHRTDIWSLGVVLYEMLTGELPFKGDYEQAVLYAILHEEPASILLDIPDYLKLVIDKALEKDQNLRYQQIQELFNDLESSATSGLTSAPREKSIIVLPFENISPDPEQEYFSDGLTEEIISDLSQIHDLLVISRSSAMTFKGTKKKIGEIAKEVNVQFVLEGSVRKAGNNLRITAQLIDAITDGHLWAEKYSGTLDDVFDIQEKVSRSIVEALKVELLPGEEKQIAERSIEDAQAYDCYLKARHEIWTWTEAGLERALKHLLNGLDIIGENILIYFGIGCVYFTYVNVGFKTKKEYLDKAKEYADKIFKLDPESYHGHLLLGITLARLSKVNKGVIHIKKTLSKDPDNPDALYWLGIMLSNSGKTSIAKPLAERLIKIDPLNPANYSLSAWIHFLEGQYKHSMEIYLKAYQMDSENPFTGFLYVQALLYNNHIEEACLLSEKHAKKTPNHLLTKIGQCLIYAIQGKKRESIELLSNKVKDKAREDLWAAWIIATCDSLINENEKALDSLEYAINLGFINYPFLNEIDPFLENIRGEERFKKLMERVKHEWENFEV